MICKNCIHYEICCNEGRDDEALTFCADFFEVVRCKDCKYCEKTEEKYEGDRFEPTDIVCTVFSIYTHPNEFCSYGERKETE